MVEDALSTWLLPTLGALLLGGALQLLNAAVLGGLAGPILVAGTEDLGVGGRQHRTPQHYMERQNRNCDALDHLE